MNTEMKGDVVLTGKAPSYSTAKSECPALAEPPNSIEAISARKIRTPRTDNSEVSAIATE